MNSMSLWQNFGVTRKLIFVNTTHQIVGKALSVFSTLIISFYLARSWGASGFGDFSKITTFVSLFYLLVDFGLNAVYLQKAGSDAQSSWWRAFVSVRLYLALSLYFVALLFAIFLPGSQNQGYTTFVRLGIFIFAPTILFQAIITSTNALFQKSLNYQASALALASGSLISISSLFILLLLFPALGVISGVLALLFGSLMTAATAYYLARPFMPQIHISNSPIPYQNFLALGWPLGLTLLVNLIYVRLDSIILTLTRPTSEVGIYALAYKVFDVGLVLPTFFMNAVYPLLLNRRLPDRTQPSSDFWRLFTKAAIALIALSVLVVPLAWLLSPLLSLIHSEFKSSVTAFRILTISFPWFFLSSLLMWTIIALGGQKPLLFVYILGLVVNLTFNIYLTPAYGYLAAAWITFGSEALVFLALSFLLFKIKIKQKGHLI